MDSKSRGSLSRSIAFYKILRPQRTCARIFIHFSLPFTGPPNKSIFQDRYPSVYSFTISDIWRRWLCRGSDTNSESRLTPATLGEFLNGSRKEDHCDTEYVFNSPLQLSTLLSSTVSFATENFKMIFFAVTRCLLLTTVLSFNVLSLPRRLHITSSPVTIH